MSHGRLCPRSHPQLTQKVLPRAPRDIWCTHLLALTHLHPHGCTQGAQTPTDNRHTLRMTSLTHTQLTLQTPRLSHGEKDTWDPFPSPFQSAKSHLCTITSLPGTQPPLSVHPLL